MPATLPLLSFVYGEGQCLETAGGDLERRFGGAGLWCSSCHVQGSSHGIARGREGITLGWDVLHNSTSVWREQERGARAWWLPPGGPGCPHGHGREGTNLYTPKSGSHPRETNTKRTLRPALSIHRDLSGRGSSGPSIPPLTSWKVRISILILQLTGAAVGMATPHTPSPSAGWALAVKPGLRGANTGPTPAPGLDLPRGTGISAQHRLGAPQHHPALHHHPHSRQQSRAHPYKQCGRTGDPPSPLSPHQALSLPPLPFPHVTLALHVILLLD